MMERCPEGVWAMEGYGKIIRSTETRFSIFDTTKISALLVKTGEVEEFSRGFDLLEPTDDDSLVLRAKNGVTRYRLTRLPGLPRTCRQTYDTASPELNFEVFRHALEENYAFFGLRGVDWPRECRSRKPAVHPEMDQAELEGLLASLLVPLKDSHTRLHTGSGLQGELPDHRLVRTWAEEFGPLDILHLYHRGFEKLTLRIGDTLKPGTHRRGMNDLIQWGHLSGSVGYLAILAMQDIFSESANRDFAGFEVISGEELRAFEDTLDRALEDLADTEALVLDLRFNPGGHDAAALALAGRFTADGLPGFSKKAVTETGFTPQQDIILEPRGRRPYTGPVVLLQGKAAASAAEVFILALLERPRTLRLGEATRGILSDTLGKHLPNGWTVTLSNEIYRDSSGRGYEVTGIPPDIAAPDPGTGDFYDDLDAQLRSAEEILRNPAAVK